MYTRKTIKTSAALFLKFSLYFNRTIEYHLKLSSDIPYYLYSCIISDTEPQVARLKALSSPPALEADAFVI